jgi:hypothetical protein
VYYFMDQYDTIQNLTPLYISKILFGDDEGEDGFESEDYDLSNDFVDDIA